MRGFRGGFVESGIHTESTTPEKVESGIQAESTALEKWNPESTIQAESSPAERAECGTQAKFAPATKAPDPTQKFASVGASRLLPSLCHLFFLIEPKSIYRQRYRMTGSVAAHDRS